MDGMVSTALLCAALAAVCVLAVLSYRKKLKNGCCGGAGDAVKRVRPADRSAAHYPYVRRVEIEGMHCKNCALRVENAFNSMEGVFAKVDLGAKSAVVRSKRPLSDGELREAVWRCGYRAVGFSPA